MSEIIIAILIVTGSLFCLIAAVGMVRLLFRGRRVRRGSMPHLSGIRKDHGSKGAAEEMQVLRRRWGLRLGSLPHLQRGGVRLVSP